MPFIVKHVDAVLEALGAPGNLNALGSTLGGTGIRQVETLYIASLMKEWVDELIEAVKSGEYGPLEQALIGVPVGDIKKPINALRTVHSFDPCTACAVHVTEPATGKHFETVTSPWGVK